MNRAVSILLVFFFACCMATGISIAWADNPLYGIVLVCTITVLFASLG